MGLFFQAVSHFSKFYNCAQFKLYRLNVEEERIEVWLLIGAINCLDNTPLFFTFSKSLKGHLFI